MSQLFTPVMAIMVKNNAKVVRKEVQRSRPPTFALFFTIMAITGVNNWDINSRNEPLRD